MISKLENGVASSAKCKLLSCGVHGDPELVSAQINHAFRNRDTPPRSLKRDNIRIREESRDNLILTDTRASIHARNSIHIHARIYIYIHITSLNKILDSLTLPIPFHPSNPVFHDEILMTLSTRFDPRPIFSIQYQLSTEPRYPFLD